MTARALRALGAYALVCAATQMLWLTYAPITAETARVYGVSESAVGVLSEVFPLLYVALAIPAGRLLDGRLRPVLAVGSLLVAAGGLLRLVHESFAWALAGQLVVALAQPVVLSAVAKLAAEQLPPERRADGIALGSAGSFLGMLIALLLGPWLGSHDHLRTVLIVEAALALAPALWLAALLRGSTRDRREAQAVPPQLAAGAMRTLWAIPAIRTLCALVGLGFGIFVALATWLQTLLAPAGVSETGAGAMLVGMVVVGVLGCALLPPWVSSRRAESSFMTATALVGCGACAACGLVAAVGVRLSALLLLGLFLLPALPLILTAAERLAGPLAGSAGALVWMAGNLGGIIVALIVQALVHHVEGAFLAMAAIALLALPLAARLRGELAPGLVEARHDVLEDRVVL